MSDRVYCGVKAGLVPGSERVWIGGRLFKGSCSGEPPGPRVPFGWGMKGAPALALARVLLLDSLGSRKAAAKWASDFADQVVERLAERWVLTAEEIEGWYRAARPLLSTQEVDRDGEAEEVRLRRGAGPDPAQPGAAPAADGADLAEGQDRGGR